MKSERRFHRTSRRLSALSDGVEFRAGTPRQCGNRRPELTPSNEFLQNSWVSENEQTPFQKALRWMATYSDFPRQRLSERAELLLLITVAADAEELGSRHAQKKPGLQFNPNYAAQIRNYTAMRRRAHITCDNSAKT